MKTEYCEGMVITHLGKYCIVVFMANLCLGFNKKLIQYMTNLIHNTGRSHSRPGTHS